MLAIVAASLVLLLYTYAGYPVVVVMLARLFPMRLRTDPAFEPHVTAIIPVFDAKSFVRPKLESLMAQDYPADKFDVLVYSDASTDGSDDEVLAIAAEHPGRVRLIRGEKRRGKPTALNVMRREAQGDVLLMTDIRQPLVPGAVRTLVRAMSDPSVGTASGNLVLVGDTGAGFYWHYENAIRRAEASFRSMVGVTGPLYAIRREDLGEVPGDIILDDMWIPLGLRLRGKRLVLCPDAIARDQAFSDDRELGRKVRTLAGNYQLFSRMPRLLFPFANPIWFETFSHKILRLLAPWLLVVLAATSVTALAFPVASPAELWSLRAVVAGQAIFFLIALLGPRAGRLAGAARTFVVLNYAAVAGLVRFVRGAQKVTW